MTVHIPVSVGELIDKLTILHIKSERIADRGKLDNVVKERELLAEIVDRELPHTEELGAATAELRAVNESLWTVEDELRALEANGEFSSHFVEQARQVYHLNDERARIKSRINAYCGSEIVEEKSYSAYHEPGT